jgi:hypothetical protein
LTRQPNPPRLHGFDNVLEVLLPEVVAANLDLATYLPISVIGYAHAARLRDPLKPRRNVDAVAKDVVVIDMMSPTWMPMRNSIR